MVYIPSLPLTLSSTIHNSSISYTARPGYCRAGTLSTGVKKPGPRPGLHWWQCGYSVAGTAASSHAALCTSRAARAVSSDTYRLRVPSRTEMYSSS